MGGCVIRVRLNPVIQAANATMFSCLQTSLTMNCVVISSKGPRVAVPLIYSIERTRGKTCVNILKLMLHFANAMAKTAVFILFGNSSSNIFENTSLCELCYESYVCNPNAKDFNICHLQPL